MSVLRFSANTLMNYYRKGITCTQIGPLRYFQFKNLNRPIRMHILPLQKVVYGCVDRETQHTHILPYTLWFRSIYYSLWVHEYWIYWILIGTGARELNEKSVTNIFLKVYLEASIQKYVCNYQKLKKKIKYLANQKICVSGFFGQRALAIAARNNKQMHLSRIFWFARPTDLKPTHFNLSVWTVNRMYGIQWVKHSIVQVA